jgi:hypothetical protein
MPKGSTTSPFAVNAISPYPVPYPSPSILKSFSTSESPASRPRLPDPATAHAARKAAQAKWAELNLRQQWVDTDFMRGHLRVAGLRVHCSNEPATVARIKSRLRRINVHSPEILEAIGMPLAKFLMVNPKLPLWAALALVLESTGRFTPNEGGAV